MPKRPKEEQNEHEKLINELAEALEYDDKFSDIHTDNNDDEYPRPEVVNKRRPDVTATYAGRTIIIEVETESSIQDRHTSRQWTAFQKAVDEDENKYGGFVVVVPDSLDDEVQSRADELDVDPEVWCFNQQ